jgi:hypothetical protein
MEMGDRAINEMPDGRLYFCVKVPRSDIKKWCEKLLRLWDRLPADDGQKATGGLAALMEDMDRVQHGADDVRTVMDQVVANKYQRTLEVAHDARGAPYRALPDVMATLTEIVKPAHWPLRGPVTILWVIQFCLEHGGSCTGRHTKWVAEGGLTPADAGVTLHLAAAKVMQLAVQYDQLNVGTSPVWNLSRGNSSCARRSTSTNLLQPGGKLEMRSTINICFLGHLRPVMKSVCARSCPNGSQKSCTRKQLLTRSGARRVRSARWR